MESPDNPELTRSNENEQKSTKNMDVEKESGIWPPYCNPSYVMPEQIEVKVVVAGGENYFFPVTIVKMNSKAKGPGTFKKPYLGGYRNRTNGKV
jgi:hypothetical protein